MEFRRYPERLPLNLVTSPFIYMMIGPLFILDIFLEIYHHVCFPAYGLEYVKRSEYIRIDRHKLKYLTLWEKLNCVYCGYANGLLHYASEIAGRTEKYWCGIKHHEGGEFKAPEHHKEFLPYGDEAAFREYVQCKLQKNGKTEEQGN
jgi:hypothetical protein